MHSKESGSVNLTLERERNIVRYATHQSGLNHDAGRSCKTCPVPRRGTSNNDGTQSRLQGRERGGKVEPITSHRGSGVAGEAHAGGLGNMRKEMRLLLSLPMPLCFTEHVNPWRHMGLIADAARSAFKGIS